MAANEKPDELVPAKRSLARLWGMGPAAKTLRVWSWAGVTGALAAAAVVGFRWLTQWVEELATGQRGGLVVAALSLSPWHRALVCTAGGFIAGLVLQGGTVWARRGPGGAVNLDYIDAARAGRVDLNDRTTLTRTVSSLFSGTSQKTENKAR